MSNKQVFFAAFTIDPVDYSDDGQPVNAEYVASHLGPELARYDGMDGFMFWEGFESVMLDHTERGPIDAGYLLTGKPDGSHADKPNLETSSMAIISNCHLSRAARAWLDNMSERNDDARILGGSHVGAPIGNLGATLYGWFAHVPAAFDKIQDGIPEELREVFERLHKANIAYVLFDRDGREVDFLASYDFDTDQRTEASVTND